MHEGVEDMRLEWAKTVKGLDRGSGEAAKHGYVVCHP